MARKIVGFGEVMMRLSTPAHQRFVQTGNFEVNYGGSEANVLVSLANFGSETALVTKLPNTSLGQAALNEIRRYGVNTDFIKRDHHRLGLYFLESGASVRSSSVIYDRANSSIAKAKPSDFDIDTILEEATWFHTTGITAALSDSCLELTRLFLQKAKEKGIHTSLDLNYREKLWDKKTARKAFHALSEYVDVCMGIDVFAEDIIEKDQSFSSKNEELFTNGKLNTKGFERIFQEMKRQFDFEYISSTSRINYSASKNGLHGMLYADDRLFISKAYEFEIIDRVGGGDAFSSGLIYGLNQKWNHQQVVEFATAASAMKHSIPGDYNHASKEEVFDLMNQKGVGKIQR